MKSFKEIAEAHYASAADYRISASGRKVHRMKKIADDPRDLDHDGDVDADDKKLAKESVVPDHMKGKQKPYVSSDGKGNYEVLGNTGQTKATFSRKEHGKDAQSKAQAHLKSKYDEYMKEEVIDESVNKSDVPAYLRKKNNDKLTLKDLDKERTQNRSHPETLKKINGTQTEGCAPVAPVPDRKYIKGTPEWKANKEKNKPRTGHPTNEEVELDEAVDKQEQRLLVLARLGLVDKSEVSKLRIAIEQFKSDKTLSIAQRGLLFGVLTDLISLVTGDDMVFNRVKLDIQKEDYEIIEEEDIIVETKDDDKDDKPPFDGPYTKKPSATPGKHGSGYSTARHLARLALQKQQQKKQGK